MNPYTELAGFYDALTEDISYEKWAGYYKRHFIKNGRDVRIILDLACGTGNIACLFAKCGYDVIGADRSEDMLGIACEKARKTPNPPLFLKQDMKKLDLYGTVDAVVCGLDSINYVKPNDLTDVFRRVRLFLAPGGMFIFDINTIDKFEAMDGEIFTDEKDGIFCVWRVSLNRKKSVCKYYVDIFKKDGKLYKRSFEEHKEYVYSENELYSMLYSAGFKTVKSYGELKFRKPCAGERRIFITAK